MNRRAFLLLMGMAAATGGCSMAPDYARPTAPVPGTWPGGPAYQKEAMTPAPPEVSRLPWREFLADEKLQKVVDISLRNNRDLRTAALNVEQARALYGIQRASVLPAVNGAASWSKARVPADLSGTGNAMTVEEYQANLGLSAWEIDFFGRIRSLTEQARQEYLATEEARRSAQILLVSQVAQTYLLLAADRETLELARTTLEAQQAQYDLVNKRLEHGLGSDLDMHRAQTQVDTAKVDVARYTQLAAQDENALNLLAGATVPAALKPENLNGVSPLKDLSPGVSSEVLLNRPDVRQAEDLLKGAYANIGAARAAFFPRITLTTSIGTGSDELLGLFKSGSGAWAFAPQVTVPIFDARLGPALKVTEVQRQLAIAQYEKAIQSAFREVADALAAQAMLDQQITAQESLVHAADETYRLSNARYTKGIDSYLSVLDAQRSLYGAQQQLVALRLARLANQVKLYAALGGGWQPSTETARASK